MLNTKKAHNAPFLLSLVFILALMLGLEVPRSQY